jgi:O-antigen/teichoic acid export membrane protein
VVLILLRFNLIAVVSAQALSILIIRILSYRTIYTPAFKQRLQSVKAQARKEILKPVYPNAVKVGINGILGFIVLRSSMIIGSLYFSLNVIASYGITMQITAIILSIASVYYVSYLPQVAKLRTQNDNISVKQWYLKSCFLSFFTFLSIGLLFIFLGDSALSVIKSQTLLLPKPLIATALLVAFLEVNININANLFLSKNEVPYLGTSIVVGVTTLILLFVFLKYTDLGVLGIIIAPGIAECLHWIWMIDAIKDLKISNHDICQSLCSIKKIF